MPRGKKTSKSSQKATAKPRARKAQSAPRSKPAAALPRKAKTKAKRQPARGARTPSKTRQRATVAVAPPAAAAPADAPRLLSPDEVKRELTQRWDELQEQRLRAEAVFEKHRDDLLARADVTGAHVGLRRKEGRIVSPLEYCIRVHVAEKFPPGHPLLANPLPTDLEGVRVDVLARSYERADAAAVEGRFVSPIRGGIPIASQQTPGHFGTLGTVVFSAGRPRYLTNQHVAGGAGTIIVQPPNSQTPSGAEPVIGGVLDSERSQDIDAAIIQPTGPRTWKVGVVGHNNKPIKGIFLPGVLTVADEHVTQCFKIGAMTGGTKDLGTVSNVNAAIKIDGFGVMVGQILVESETGEDLIEPGDSGSVLIAPTVQSGLTVNLLVGLVHARGDDGSIVACHLSKVQSRFGISVTNT